MTKPLHRLDVENLKRQLREEFQLIARGEVQEQLKRLDSEDPNPESIEYSDEEPSGDGEQNNDNNGGTPEKDVTDPFKAIKFMNSNKVFTVPTDDKKFGQLMLSADGTLTVNVTGKIIDSQTGIENYKIRVKRIG